MNAIDTESYADRIYWSRRAEAENFAEDQGWGCITGYSVQYDGYAEYELVAGGSFLYPPQS
jgi:hypothetical protein